MIKCIISALAMVLVTFSESSFACSMFPNPFRLNKNSDRESLVVISNDVDLKMTKQETFYRTVGSNDREMKIEVSLIEGTLSLKKIRCWWKPKRFGECPNEMIIPFKHEDDGAACPHPLEEMISDNNVKYRVFQLREYRGTWYISRAAKRTSQL
jgi:hypothetical protein